MTQNENQKRNSLGLSSEIAERFNFTADRLNFSKAKLIHCFMLLSDDEIDGIVQRSLPKITEAKQKKSEARAKLKSMSPDEITRLLELAEKEAK